MFNCKKLLLITLFGLSIPFNGFVTAKESHHKESLKTYIDNFDPERDTEALVNLCHKEWNLLVYGGDNFSFNEKIQYCKQTFQEYHKYANRYGVKVLHENDKLAGFVAYDAHDPKKGLIELLAVEQNFRGNGYGKVLLEHSIDELHNKNINSIDICVRKDNIPALALYKKNGFNKISDRKNVPNGVVCLEYNPSDIQDFLFNQNSKA